MTARGRWERSRAAGDVAPVVDPRELVAVRTRGSGRAVIEGHPEAVRSTVARIREDGRLARPVGAAVGVARGRVRVEVELRTATPPPAASSGPAGGHGGWRAGRRAAVVVGGAGVLAGVVWLATPMVVAVVGWVTAMVAWLAVYWGLLVVVPLVVMVVNRSFGSDGTPTPPRRQPTGTVMTKVAAPGTAEAGASRAATEVTGRAAPKTSASRAAAEGGSAAGTALDPVTERWLATLRDPRNDQSYGGMHGYRVGDGVYELDGSHCATGWLYESIDPNGWTNGGLHKSRKRMHRKYGKRFLRDIARKNDRGWALPRIADHIERELRGWGR